MVEMRERERGGLFIIFLHANAWMAVFHLLQRPVHSHCCTSSINLLLSLPTKSRGYDGVLVWWWMVATEFT